MTNTYIANWRRIGFKQAFQALYLDFLEQIMSFLNQNILEANRFLLSCLTWLARAQCPREFFETYKLPQDFIWNYCTLERTIQFLILDIPCTLNCNNQISLLKTSRPFQCYKGCYKYLFEKTWAFVDWADRMALLHFMNLWRFSYFEPKYQKHLQHQNSRLVWHLALTNVCTCKSCPLRQNSSFFLVYGFKMYSLLVWSMIKHITFQKN